MLIVEKVDFMLDRDNNWKNPFGEGHAGERIIRILGKDLA